MIGLAISVALLAGGADTTCGTKTLYGKTYTLYAHNVSCAEVKKITSRKCDVFDEPWFCFSAHTPGPPLYWGKGDERFEEKASAWIDTRRPACARSEVTAADWKRATAQRDDQFPTERQLLADDLIRCKQLRGKTRASVLKLLGRQDEGSGRSLHWSLGPERSIMQVDSELLGVEFDRKNRVRSLEIWQG